MEIRKRLEEEEIKNLSPFASKSKYSRGRKKFEESCNLRTDFERDRDRIIHSKSFRRLMHKTQVFLSPEGDHYRTRLTHTLEVSQVARTIARSLNLNENLTEAIAMGHDLGHTPFGHTGETILNNLTGHFRHNEQSKRVVELLESHKNERGLNLTYEVVDGILNHSGSLKASTLEGQIVALSDRIAYINHDIDDALRSNAIRLEDLPKSSSELFGSYHGKRIDTMVKNVVYNSLDQNYIKMDEEHKKELDKLRNFMFKNVYQNEKVKGISALEMAEVIITDLYGYYNKYPDKLPLDYKHILAEEGESVAVKDFIAGMTDRYAINLHKEIFPDRAKPIEVIGSNAFDKRQN